MVYIVKVSYYQKPYRRVLMETWVGRLFLLQAIEQKSEGRFWSGIQITRGVWK